MSDIDEIKKCCLSCNSIRQRVYIATLYREFELPQGKVLSVSTPYCNDRQKCVDKAKLHHQQIEQRLAKNSGNL